MNCYNHPDVSAVASCMDCGKGLCIGCTDLYQMPICSACNLKRVKQDKGKNLRGSLFSVILFLFGFVVGQSEGGFGIALAFGWVLAGVPWGWRNISSVQPKMFLFLSVFGWFLYFFIKFLLSCLVGLVEMPRGFLATISTYQKELYIKDNLNNSTGTQN